MKYLTGISLFLLLLQAINLIFTVKGQLVEHHHVGLRHHNLDNHSKKHTREDMILEPEESDTNNVAVSTSPGSVSNGDSFMVRPRLLFARSRYSSLAKSKEPDDDYYSSEGTDTQSR